MHIYIYIYLYLLSLWIQETSSSALRNVFLCQNITYRLMSQGWQMVTLCIGIIFCGDELRSPLFIQFFAISKWLLCGVNIAILSASALVHVLYVGDLRRHSGPSGSQWESDMSQVPVKLNHIWKSPFLPFSSEIQDRGLRKHQWQCFFCFLTK